MTRKKRQGGKSRSYMYGCLLARDLGDNPRNGHCLTLLYFSSLSVTGRLGDLRVEVQEIFGNEGLEGESELQSFSDSFRAPANAAAARV